MGDRSAADVFLSYASTDAAASEVVVRALADAGVRVWRDVTGIKGGWYKERIVAGMRTARVVLALCSPNSLASTNVAAELDLAWDDLNKPVVSLWMVDRQKCVIPDRLRMQLSKANQFVPMHDRTEEVWVRTLLENLAVHGVTGGSADPAPPSDAPPAIPAPPLELIDTAARAQLAQVAAARLLGVEFHWTNVVGLSFRLIPPGEFLFGPSDDATTADPFAAEQVPVPRPFWMGTVPLSLRAVREFLRDPKVDPVLRRDKLFCPDARTTAADDLPATGLSLFDAEAVCRWLSARAGRVYRVPTEVEWEYAGRAGCRMRCPPRVPLPLAGAVSLPDSRRANSFGLWDVLGNVSEWTSTAYQHNHSPPPISATPPMANPAARTIRGGGWRTPPADLRLCWRKSQAAHRRADDLGVRVLCEVGG